MAKKLLAVLAGVVIIATLAFFLLNKNENFAVDNSPRVIVIQPYQGFPPHLIKVAEEGITSKYNLIVKVLPAVPLPATAWYQPRQRYIADSLLIDLQKRIPANAYKIIGLTNKDISTKKGEYKNYGIMGQGFIGGKSCVVSIFRLHKGNASEKLFTERFVKVITHEIGHTLGLVHCETPKCIMQDCKGTMKTIDTEESNLCLNCKAMAAAYWSVD